MRYYLRTMPKDKTVLTRVCPKLQDGEMNQPALVQNMRRILTKHKGLGLAAPQVGVSKRVIIVKNPVTNKLSVYFNPSFRIKESKLTFMPEGCLSLPDYEHKVARWQRIEVDAHNERGEHIMFTASGLEARIIQHEIDHLNGITIKDTSKREMSGVTEDELRV